MVVVWFEVAAAAVSVVTALDVSGGSHITHIKLPLHCFAIPVVREVSSALSR